MQPRPTAARRRAWLAGRAFRTRHTRRHAESPGKCQAAPPHGCPCDPPSSDRTPPVAPPSPRTVRRARRPRAVRFWSSPGRARAPGRWCRRHAARRRREHAGRSPQPGTEQELRLADPIGQRGAVELDAFAGIDDGLAMQRRWSQYFETSTCAIRPGPGRPRSIGSDGIGACTIVSHDRQLSFGRTCRITLKQEGTYSSISRSSSPIRLKTVPPQAGQVQGGSWMTVSRGRCPGSVLRTGCLRWCVLAGVSVLGGGGDSARQRVCRSGVGVGGHRTGRLRWSCETSTLAERGSDDRGNNGAVRAAGEGG